MTLRCECGGQLRVTGGTDPADAGNGFHESYRCEACGRTGGLDADPATGETYTGCVTDDGRLP